jgi:hypothetical protein
MRREAGSSPLVAGPLAGHYRARMNAIATVRGGAPLYRFGGWSAVLLGVSYIAIVGLYSLAGAVPSQIGEPWLQYLDGKTAIWWGITGLSVLTDLLFLPMVAALYLALRGAPRALVLSGIGLIGLFVALDLAITWPNYASLIGLTDTYSSAADAGTRSVAIAGATFASTVLSSPLFKVYAVLVPSVGIGALGIAMVQVGFGRWAGYVGLATGILGTVSVLGSVAWSSLGAAVIATSVLTTLWVLIVGYRLIRSAS